MNFTHWNKVWYFTRLTLLKYEVPFGIAAHLSKLDPLGLSYFSTKTGVSLT